MTETTYYGLNIVEGNDIVNPLNVDNPNYERIDEVMHDNAVAGVTLATEIGNGNVHALSRANSECAVIRFIATTDWKKGDTVTVDGVPVTALLPSGETLPDGAYVINANVLCILTGTSLTVYAERKKADNASEIAYNDTNVMNALNAINNNFIMHNDVVYTEYGNIYLYKIGRVVFATGQLGNIPLPEIWQASAIATLPEAYKPVVEVAFLVDNGYDRQSVARLNGNGILSIQSITDGASTVIPNFTFSTCYLTLN